MKTKTLIKLFIIPVFAAAIMISGCSKNGNIVGPNSSQVTFRISQQQGIYGGTQFLFQPSANIHLTRVISNYQAERFADTLSYTNVNYVYSKDSLYIINEYTGVQNGQQWNFNFSGNVPGQNNSNYNVTTNYTVQ